MNQQSRRNFVKNSVAAGLGASLPAIESAPKDMFVHHVLFYLKNADNEADKAKLLEGLNKLAKVPSIKLVHIGTPAATNRAVIERTYAYSWLCFSIALPRKKAIRSTPFTMSFGTTMPICGRK